PTASNGPTASRVGRLLKALRKQQWIIALGIVPMLIFLTLLTLFIWGLPPGRPPLTPNEIVALITTTPIHALPQVVPFIALDNIVLWGEAIVFVGWLIAFGLLPRSPLRRRAEELAAMLLAGFLTWWLVARFAVSVSLATPERHTGTPALSF